MYILVDVGSTWTKLTAVDDKGRIAAQASAPTTADSNILLGYNAAFKEISAQVGRVDYQVYACSSAAGGLAMIASGLVPELTGQAARLAVLGAGAKVLKVFGYSLNPDDLQLISTANPDMILLAGGTDGGNRSILLDNVRALAATVQPLPVVLAGNRSAVHQARVILDAAGFSATIAGNVMPELGRLEIESARSAIRELFLTHIVRAKGVDKLCELLAGPLVPTPSAVMAGGKLLAREFDQLLMVDIGGATTDVYSFGAEDVPAGMMRKGLQPPREMRTVEADIGMRHSLSSLVEQAGLESILSAAPNRELWRAELDLIMGNPRRLVSTGVEELETVLARAAAKISISRHGGTVERIYSPAGHVDVLYGKDLRRIKTVVGIGGVFTSKSNPRAVLEIGAEGLLPENPKLMTDTKYIMAAAGLLADIRPDLASRILADSLAAL